MNITFEINMFKQIYIWLILMFLYSPIDLYIPVKTECLQNKYQNHVKTFMLNSAEHEIFPAHKC